MVDHISSLSVVGVTEILSCSRVLIPKYMWPSIHVLSARSAIMRLVSRDIFLQPSVMLIVLPLRLLAECLALSLLLYRIPLISPAGPSVHSDAPSASLRCVDEAASVDPSVREPLRLQHRKEAGPAKAAEISVRRPATPVIPAEAVEAATSLLR